MSYKHFFRLTCSGERSKIAESCRSVQQLSTERLLQWDYDFRKKIVERINCLIMLNVTKLAWIGSTLRSTSTHPIPPQNRNLCMEVSSAISSSSNRRNCYATTEHSEFGQIEAIKGSVPRETPPMRSQSRRIPTEC